MELMKGTITKLKELIFIKKGTGQDCKEDEKLLLDLEKQAADREQGAAKIRQALEENDQNVGKCRERRDGFKKKLIALVKAWQDTALDLHREEREIEELHESRIRLSGEARLGSHSRPPQRSINIGSTRARWVDDDLDILTEEFRRRLILDNKEYFTKRKPARKRGPIPSAEQVLKYIPAQAAALIARGIPLPDGIKQRHDAWLKRNFGTPGVDPSKVDWYND